MCISRVAQVEKGEHRRSFVYERCEVHLCCTAAAAVVTLLHCCCCCTPAVLLLLLLYPCCTAAAVVPLLYCAGAYEIQSKCVGWNIVPHCVQDGAPT